MAYPSSSVSNAHQIQLLKNFKFKSVFFDLAMKTALRSGCWLELLKVSLHPIWTQACSQHSPPLSCLNLASVVKSAAAFGCCRKYCSPPTSAETNHVEVRDKKRFAGKWKWKLKLQLKKHSVVEFFKLSCFTLLFSHSSSH